VTCRLMPNANGSPTRRTGTTGGCEGAQTSQAALTDTRLHPDPG
jgi:hypothetical protein